MLKQVLTQMWQALRQRTMTWGTRPRMVIVAVATLVLVVAAAAVTLHPPVSPSVAEEKQRAAEDPVPTVSTDPDEGEGEETADVENAVDFSKLKEENQDIYAWITIPGTNVNNPVLQSSDDDTYYLDHNRSGKASPYGAIFSQSMNALDFSDPVTVLYGHNTDDPIHLFRSLHNFEYANFFAEHDVMYVFTPGRVFIYKIVAAYEYDDRHILNSFDFKNPQALQEYYNFVLNPDSSRRNIREGATLDAATDKILQLSTCMVEEYHGPHRFIVTGVLKDNRPIDSQSAINLSTL